MCPLQCRISQQCTLWCFYPLCWGIHRTLLSWPFIIFSSWIKGDFVVDDPLPFSVCLLKKFLTLVGPLISLFFSSMFPYFLIFLKSGCNCQSLVCCKLNGSIFLSQCKWNNCVSYNQHYLAFEEIWWLPRECIPIIKSLQLLLFFCLNTEILLLMNGWVLKDYL